MLSPMRRALPALMAVLALLAPATGLAGVQYRCLVMNETRSSCCCPSQPERQESKAAAAAEISRTPCCDLEQASVKAAHPRTEASSSRVQTPPTALSRWERQLATVPLATAEAPSARGLSPPTRGSPAFIRHCSLLL